MVTYTAYTGADNWVDTSGTNVSSYDGDTVDPVQSVGGLQPQAWQGSGSTTAANRTAYTSSGGYAGTSATNVAGYDGDTVDPAQSVGGLQPQAWTAGASRSDPAPRSGYDNAAGYVQSPVATEDEAPAYEGYNLAPDSGTIGYAETDEKESQRWADGGSLVPMAYFRNVGGTAYDAETGDPITDGVFILALDNFAVAGTVNGDGAFSLKLLRQEYQEFVLVGESPDTEYDYVWYEEADNPDIGTKTDSVDLAFNTAEAKPPESLGLSAGDGVMFG